MSLTGSRPRRRTGAGTQLPAGAGRPSGLLCFVPRFVRAYRELDTLADREQWSHSDVEAWQLQRLNGTWRHAIAHVPHYRELAATFDLPDRFGSLSEYSAMVPVLPKATVKTDARRLLSERAPSGSWHGSSGSTGIPTSFFWGRQAHQEVMRSRYRMLAAWGVDICARTALLWGYGAAHSGGLAGRLEVMRLSIRDRLRNRLRLSAYQMGTDDLREHLRRLAAFQPATLYAYSTAAYLLAHEAEAEGFRCDSLELCTLSAEPAYPHMVTAIERAFGVPVAIEYGATECPLIAGEGPDRRLRVREDIVLVETRPVGDGRHEIILTVLGNPSFPLLRYAIGDMTHAPLDRPARGFSILKDVAGRQNDLISTGSGAVLHPMRFDFLFGFRLAKAVRRYRIHQGIDGATSVSVEVGEPVASRDLTHLKRELEDLLEGFPVTLEIVSALPSARHKHRWTTSDFHQRALVA